MSDIKFPYGYRPSVFISQPMNGKTVDEIVKVRNTTIGKILNKWPNAIIIDSLFQDSVTTTGNVGLNYLAQSVSLLAQADVVWFCKGWGQARGCRIENQCAFEYGIPMVIEDYAEDGE